MKTIQYFFDLNQNLTQEQLAYKMWISRAYLFKIKKKLSWQNIILNPNCLARMYNRLNIKRDKFFENCLIVYYKDNGNTIRRIRIKKRLTMDELVQKSKISKSTIIALENNHLCNPTYTVDCVLSVLFKN